MFDSFDGVVHGCCNPEMHRKVVAMLVTALFANTSLEFSKANELHHVELFAGDCAVSRGEGLDKG